MRLNSERTKTLQALLKECCGLDYTDEQAQEAGMAIMRFVIAKAQRKAYLSIKEKKKDERRTAN